MDCTENNPNIAPEPLIEDMDRFNLNLMYSKMSGKNRTQTNKMSGGLRNVASIISTASEFPPFPISLVMKIDEPSMELRLPLLNSTFSDSLGMTHTVLDEYGILGSEIFQFKFPGNEHTVNVQAADDKYKKTLKTKIENSELKENGFKNGTTINWSNKRNAFQPVVENSIRNIPENIRQDLIFLDCESTNNLTMNKNDLKGLDFCILPAGELLIGRSSTGEWTIFYREPNKISQQEDAAISDFFQKYRNIQNNSDLDNVLETPLKENKSIKSEIPDNILGLSHQKSHNKTPNHTSESNITGQQKEVVENIGQAKPPNVTFFIEQRQHSNPSVQHFQGYQSPAVTLPQDTTTVNQRQCSKPAVQHFQIQQPPVTIATNTQSALHPPLQQLPVLVPIATMGQHSRPVTHSSVFQQPPVVKATNQQYPKPTLNLPSIQQQPPVTIATNEPRPVMMIHSNGKALKLIPLDKNVSANFIATKQPIAQDDTLKVKVELPCESENDVEVKVKEEPVDHVDTGYEEDIPNVETLQEINTSNMFVRMPSVNRSGSSDGEQSSSFQKTGQKRKPPESEMPTCSKYMLINQVSSLTEKSQDKPPSSSEERENSNISMGVDSDSVSGTGDPDSVRSGRFPVVNEVESDAVIYRCTEPTAGTQRQTKWGVSTFREIADELEEAGFKLDLKGEKSRFRPSLTSEELDKIAGERIEPSSNTQTSEELDKITGEKIEPSTNKQTVWGVKLLRVWLKENGKNTDFESFNASTLNDILRTFYGSLQTKKGKDYSKSALVGIRAAISRHLTSAPFNWQINITSDKQFASSNHVITGMVKILRRSGKDITNHKKCLSSEDVKQLYESGVFNVDNPKTLQYKVFWDVMLHLGRRGQEALTELKKTSFSKCYDENGLAYYKRNYRNVSLTGNDEESSEPPVSERMYSRPGDPCCPVSSLDFYFNKLHPKCDAFFQQPYIHPKMTVWYDKLPMGQNKLKSMMTRISKDAGLSQIYTNHCIRATVATSLKQAEIDVLSIMTRDKILESAKFYKPDSSERSDCSQNIEEDQSVSSVSLSHAFDHADEVQSTSMDSSSNDFSEFS